MKELRYSEAKHLLKDGDVLLFRAGDWKSVGWWITVYTGGIHSHVAMVKINGNIMCVEQREFKGGRSVDLERQVKINSGKIDVYRAASKVTVPNFDGEKITLVEKEFTNDIAKKITDDASALTGSEYGWKNIWKMFRAYAPLIRLWRRKKQIEQEVENVEAFVCSTLVAWTYRRHYMDPCPNIPDEFTNPADIASSSLFNYLFTLTSDDGDKK